METEDENDGGGNRPNIWLLLIGGAALCSAGWFTSSFPILMFIGLAPFFAILDYTIESENFWENIEMILVGMVVFFLAAFHFNTSQIIKVLGLAIVFTLPFLAFSFVHENLGARTGKFIVIIFWLGIEYVLVKIQWPMENIFLADSFQAVSKSFRWNQETGYLGASLWILFANWVFYSGTLRNGTNWFLISLGLVIVASPMLYSWFMMNGKPILRNDMMTLYESNTSSIAAYKLKGELVARTCAWLSVLILVFAFIKSKIAS